jgi:L-alanine-DL-glutamate epimerase-like enolase superfamily enzyme
MKVLVEDVLGPSLVGEDPTRVEFLWEKMYSASRLPLALAHERPYHRAGSRGETIHAISGVDVALRDIHARDGSATCPSIQAAVWRATGARYSATLRSHCGGC